MKKCKCVCENEYEFLFVCEHPYSYGKKKTYSFKGTTAWKALKSYRAAIGNFWAVKGFRRVGSKRWNSCYVKAWREPTKEFWPFNT